MNISLVEKQYFDIIQMLEREKNIFEEQMNQFPNVDYFKNECDKLSSLINHLEKFKDEGETEICTINYKEKNYLITIKEID